MADTKISALTPASALNNADITPIVQSGSNLSTTFTLVKSFLKTYFDTIYARLAAVNVFTASQGVTTVALTDAATITWDADAAQLAKVTLAGNRTLANPTNMREGFTYLLKVTQDGTGSRTLAYGTAYKWPGGTAPTLTTTAAAVDILSFYSDGTHMYGTVLSDLH